VKRQTIGTQKLTWRRRQNYVGDERLYPCPRVLRINPMNLAIPRSFSKPAAFAAHIAAGLALGIVVGDAAVEPLAAMVTPAAIMRDSNLPPLVPHLYGKGDNPNSSSFSKPGARG
jgi:hypothetical protein